MYEIKNISNNVKEIKKLHSFFKSLDKSFVPNLKRYIFFIGLGVAYSIVKDGKVYGGLVVYSIPEQNVVLNYYIPEDARNGFLSLNVLELLLNFKDSHSDKPMFIKSPDVSAYERFVKHYKDDIYELMIPDRRFR